MTKYQNKIDYIIGVDVANKHDWSYSVTEDKNLEIEGEDPNTCGHEWWEDTMLTYTTSPAMHLQKCRLCGDTRYRYEKAGSVSSRWKKVK